jgi:hypothetical protein
MTRHTLTRHLIKVHDALSANVGSYGIKDDDHVNLTIALLSDEVQTIHLSSIGLFALERSVSSSKRFGFRVRPVRSTASAELVEALQRANKALLELDTEDPSQVCAKPPLPVKEPAKNTPIQ